MGSYKGIDCESEEAKPQVGSQHKTNNLKKIFPLPSSFGAFCKNE
jgi:hypothetical protein